MFFQHDGPPPHSTCHVTEFVNEQFPNKWMGNRGRVNLSLIPIQMCIRDSKMIAQQEGVRGLWKGNL